MGGVIYMNVMKEFKNKAKQSKKTIVLPEGYEPRMINALPQIKKENLADIILLGKEAKIKGIANKEAQEVFRENDLVMSVADGKVAMPEYYLKQIIC